MSMDNRFPPSQHQKATNILVPRHRHAAPSAPWPWIDIYDRELRPPISSLSLGINFLTAWFLCLAVDATQLASELPPVPKRCDHKSCGGCWRGYPQLQFPNWTKDQVSRSKVSDAIKNYRSTDPWITYRADVLSNGTFVNVESVTATDADNDSTWNAVINAVVRLLLWVCGEAVGLQVPVFRTFQLSSGLTSLYRYWYRHFSCSDHQISEFGRCLSRIYLDLFSKCLEQGGVLQCQLTSPYHPSSMISTKLSQFCRFNIEPFFFSSSLNWIPSRYQEENVEQEGDRTGPFSSTLQPLHESIQISQ